MSFTSRWRALGEETTRTLDLVRPLDARAVSWRPSPGSWSARDVIEHLVIVEELVIKRFDATAEVQQGRRGRIAILGMRIASLLGVKVRMPLREIAPRGEGTFAELEERWRLARSALLTAIDPASADAERRLLLTHPAAGQLNCMDGMDFLREHIRHHRRQLGRIAAARAAVGG